MSHFYLNDSETVHDAVTTWTEDVNTMNFTVCAMQAGRKTKNFNPYATVDWMAYQGAPVEGMAGIVKIQKWWSGTNCANVTFPKVVLSAPNPKIFLIFFNFFFRSNKYLHLFETYCAFLPLLNLTLTFYRL